MNHARLVNPDRAISHAPFFPWAASVIFRYEMKNLERHKRTITLTVIESVFSRNDDSLRSYPNPVEDVAQHVMCAQTSPQSTEAPGSLHGIFRMGSTSDVSQLPTTFSPH
jgi:hypothetical protein